jgi:uncharacterized protein (TIGR00297 family)
MHTAHIIFPLVLVSVVFLSVKTKKLTPAAGLTGGLVAIGIYLGAAFTGIAMLGAFFLLGTLATSWGKRTKETLGAAEDIMNGRTVSQVLANGGVAAICGILAYLVPDHKMLLLLMMAASLSSAAADTLSSELGTLYGKRFYNILTFRKDTRGENGVVSLEGTLLGLAGSVIIAGIHAVAYGYGSAFITIIVAGTLGNITDSLLGATLERKGYIRNDAVNFLNTLVGALIAFAIAISI